MTTKERVQEVLDRLADDCSLEEVLYTSMCCRPWTVAWRKRRRTELFLMSRLLTNSGGNGSSAPRRSMD